LFRTAQREAWKLNARRSAPLYSLRDEERDVGAGTELADPRERMEEQLEFEAALQELRKLPERLQAVVARPRGGLTVRASDATVVA
jgi:hypothetical protein